MAEYELEEGLRQRILDVAWELFYQKGYVNTTVNDIIKKAGTSKGGFYYYFKAKDELLNSLYVFFDREYEKFYKALDKRLNSMTQLMLLTQYVSFFIEANVGSELLAELYRSQLGHKKQDYFLSPDRYYIKIVKQIITEGQKRGEIRTDMTVDELARHVLVLERGVLTDWCVQDGAFSMGYQGTKSVELYMEFMRAQDAKA